MIHARINDDGQLEQVVNKIKRFGLEELGLVEKKINGIKE
jgi:hypothetical protein